MSMSLNATIKTFENILPSVKRIPPVLRAVTELAYRRRPTLKLISSNLSANAERTEFSVCAGDKPDLSLLAI
ncbi:hypothetical protein TNCV_3108301 [Trichonephila clavipes]|uniref:Uncharacterized protein n=1 Tax=Trichonephila clavipes TaxID=2585209 RepID=A0A8X6S5M1_TRICX|nr:hypothetical protein TNCV_3108301 [Trichonephila clavipes]